MMKAVILAAGLGTRMKSDKPKVLHKLFDKEMIEYPLDALRSIDELDEIIVVLGYKADEVSRHLKGVSIVLQKEPLGSGDALNSARNKLARFEGDLLLSYADCPLIKKGTLLSLIKRHRDTNASCTLLTCVLPNPTGYGRVVRNASGGVQGIVEENEAGVFEKAIEEINVGCYCFKAPEIFRVLKEIKPSKAKKEYYLTDAVGLLAGRGARIESVVTEDKDEALGINSRQDLAVACDVVRKRILDAFMDSGVTVVDPRTTFIHEGASIGRDAVLHPFTIIEKAARIRAGKEVGPFAVIKRGSRR